MWQHEVEINGERNLTNKLLVYVVHCDVMRVVKELYIMGEVSAVLQYRTFYKCRVLDVATAGTVIWDSLLSVETCFTVWDDR